MHLARTLVRKGQKFQKWIYSSTSELETGKKITEINEEVIELKRQIADIKTIRVISYVIIFVLVQVHPEPTIIDVTSSV
jgi:hypothetical protein